MKVNYLFIAIIFLSTMAFRVNTTTSHSELEKKKEHPSHLHPLAQTHSHSHHHHRKIAFLFLLRHNLPFLEIWQEFFTFHAPKELYNIYVHSSTPYIFEQGTVFYNRTISEHIEAKWGKFSIIRATRYLLKAALLEDSSNYYFGLFSESCIPLYAFPKFYRILSSDSKSIVFTHPAEILEPRWKPEFDSVTKLMKTQYFRKSSQWFLLNRKHALIIAFYNSDDMVWEHVAAADEYFIPSTLAALKLENETTNSGGFTFVNWSSPIYHSHPQKFNDIHEDLFYHFRYAHLQETRNLTKKELKELRYHEKCAGYAGICHFAARKISLVAKFQLLHKLSWLLIDDRDDMYALPHLPSSAEQSYANESMFQHQSQPHLHHISLSSQQQSTTESKRVILLRYPGFDYVTHFLPKVRKVLINQQQPDPLLLNNIPQLSLSNDSILFWKTVENKYFYYLLDTSTKERKLFPNFFTLRFFLKLSEKDYPTKELLMKIPTITKNELETYSKHKEQQFPWLMENLLIRDKYAVRNTNNNNIHNNHHEAIWIIQSFERHLISLEKIQQFVTEGKLILNHIEMMPDVLLEQIPVGKPFH